MGLRFRRTMTLLPGIRINFGMGGMSLSLGPRGASVTIGKGGIYGNAGLPGTGGIAPGAVGSAGEIGA